ncbi:MAG: hypothetical protein DCF17_04405 [Shackletoniella antarctica]|uniref:Uncharacterized protein n=1 Tax=Shackletoniella antarctica TaxID=268115 RepID=A0A2W4YA61_9CYAN|nr:MAG: hypothetical protein DCF17_04405 [Shackletoniella antarctica]
MENYWNGTLLTTVDEALRWAANVTWNGVSPFMHLVRDVRLNQVPEALIAVGCITLRRGSANAKQCTNWKDGNGYVIFLRVP